MLNVDVKNRSISLKLEYIRCSAKNDEGVKTVQDLAVGLSELADVSVELTGGDAVIWITLDIGDMVPDKMWEDANKASGNIFDDAQRQVSLMVLEGYIKALVPKVVESLRKNANEFVGSRKTQDA